MASGSNVGGSASTASRPGTPSNAKIKQRRTKRNGPSRFQFVTATDPSHFRDKPANKIVRSQAMKHFRQVQAKKEEEQNLLLSENNTRFGSAVVQNPSTVQIRPYHDHGDTSLLRASPSVEVVEQHQRPPTTVTSSHPSQLSPYSYNPIPQHYISNDQGSTEDLTFNTALTSRPRNVIVPRIVDYEDTDRHEALVSHMLAKELAQHYQIGDVIDPFVVLPRFLNPELNALHLIRNAMRNFASESTARRWIPALLSHPYLFLSSTTLVSSWLDMRAGCSGDSRRTRMVKSEVMSMVNDLLSDSATHLSDITLMTILHLLAGEMWSADERALRIHELGVARLITQRGGLQSLHNDAVAEVAVSCCYHCDVICEAEQLPVFRDCVPWLRYRAQVPTAVPESPLFCPGDDYETINNDLNCSRPTCDILRDMRDLTNYFIANSAAVGSTPGATSEEVVSWDQRQSNITVEASEIYARLVSLPSAYTQGHPTTNDWVYEACRLTALIYTSAIIMRAPFSIAAHTYRTIPFSESIEYKTETHLAEALYEVLQRTDIANVWNNMCGVLYWVCAVGAAAARPYTASNNPQQSRSRNEGYSIWVRRCLIMHATRTLFIFILQHPIPVIEGQQKLLRVQELISIRRRISVSS